MTELSSPVRALVQTGAGEVEATGAWPCNVAAKLIGAKWDTMTVDERRNLAVVGLSTLLNEEMTRRRRAELEVEIANRPAPASPQPHRDMPELSDDQVKELHDLFGGFCTCVTHLGRDKAARLCRRKCVSCFAEGETFEARAAAAKKRREKWEAEREGFVRVLSAVVDFEAARRAKRMLKSITLMASDGKMRPILAFSADDLERWKRESRSKERGWRIRREWFEAAAVKLSERGVAKIADLPAADIIELADSAESVWKRAGRKSRAVAA